MPLPLVLKVVALGTAAVTGTGGLVWSATAGPSDGPAAVWVDDPLAGTTVGPGLLPVLAHASSQDALTGLELLVDGEPVAKDDSLERNGLLSLATFGWEAVSGRHTLVVRTAGGGTSSEPVLVIVSDDQPAPASPTPTAAPTATSSPTPSPSVSPSPTPTSSPSATPSPSAVPTTAAPSRTAAPTASPPPVQPSSPRPSPSPSPPVYGGTTTFDPPNINWDRTSGGGSTCPEPNNTVATARVARATSVTFVIGGASFPATASGSTWSAPVDPARIDGPRVTTELPVQVVARGPGGTTTTDAGTLPIRSCSKD